MRRLRCEESWLGELELGHLLVYAMRGTAPEAGHACLEGQVTVNGQLECRAGREHEESGQHCEQQDLQSAECQSGDAHRCRRGGLGD